jgi:enoyl-CoA hydratase
MMTTLFDGIRRHSPEGFWFTLLAEHKGFRETVRWRDSGEPIPEPKG